MKKWLMAFALCSVSTLSLAQTIRPEVLTALQSAQAQQQAGNLTAAKQQLARLSLTAGSLEQALVWRSQAYLSWAEEDYSAAVSYFAKALDSKKLTAQQQQEDTQNLVDLALASQQYQIALNRLQQLPVNQARTLQKLQALQALGNTQQVKQVAEQLQVKNLTVVQLESLLAADLTNKNYLTAGIWLQQLLVLESDNSQYWQQLAAVQQLAGKPQQAFATLHAAYIKQVDLDAAEWQRMLDLARASDQPWQAAQLLEDLLQKQILTNSEENQLLLAQLYWQAKDRPAAINAYQQLLKNHNHADYWLALAQLHLQQSQLDEGHKALQQAKQLSADPQQVSALALWLGQEAS